MNKIEEVVGNLNEKLWGINGNQNLNHYFSYTKAGYIEGISLDLNFDDYHVEIQMWNDENDDRKFTEEKGYEDLEKFIVKKYKNIIKDMTKITKYLCK